MTDHTYQARLIRAGRELGYETPHLVLSSGAWKYDHPNGNVVYLPAKPKNERLFKRSIKLLQKYSGSKVPCSELKTRGGLFRRGLTRDEVYNAREILYRMAKNTNNAGRQALLTDEFRRLGIHIEDF